MSFLKKIFSSILKFIRKICEALGPFFVILLVAVILFAPYIGPWLTEMGLATVGGWVTAIGEVMSGIGFWGKLGIGLGVAFLLAPEATSEVVSQIGDLVGDVAGAAGSAISSGLGGVVSGVLSSPIGWIALGIGAYFLFRSNEPDRRVEERPQDEQMSFSHSEHNAYRLNGGES